MMQSFLLSEIAQALQGRVLGQDAAFEGVSIDTRALRQGDLFVALKGERVDGHVFLKQAREQGAQAALVEHEVNDALPQLQVADVSMALGQLAAMNRQLFQGPVVAVTGSSGKTTVKEMIAAILRERGEVLATQGNLNNHLGAPLTLLAMSKQHSHAVIELGASAIGEIKYTATLTQPDVSVLTNAGHAHVEGFGGLKGVVQAKGEIFDALQDRVGVAVINADDPHASVWKERARHKIIKTFGSGNISNTDYIAHRVSVNERGTHFCLNTPEGETEIQMRLLGEHNALNAAAAAAAALSVGATLYDVKFGLEKIKPVKGRLELYATEQSLCVIDDTYNANPNSMCAAIDCLAQFQGKKIFVMGDMAELGDEAVEQHQRVGLHAKQKSIDVLYAVGRLSACALASFDGVGHLFDTQNELIEKLKKESQATILVKGSRSSKMENIVHALLERKH